jgi:archaemetzincin
VGRPPSWILRNLRRSLERALSSGVEVLPSVEPPSEAFQEKRHQYFVPSLLKDLERHRRNGLILGVTEGDLYYPGCHFLFGAANPGAGVAIISLYRLRGKVHGRLPNRRVLGERAFKEALHEMGHLLGLPHCLQDRCVMRFSNTLEETDAKDPTYCPRCRSLFPPSR